MKVRCRQCRITWDNDTDPPGCKDADHEFVLDVDLEVFDKDNKKWKRRSKTVPLGARHALASEVFPSIRTLDWHDALKTDEEGVPEAVFSMLLRDIFKLDAAPAGRDGPRAELTYAQQVRAWRKATGQDYSEQPFALAFENLIQDDPMSVVAQRCFISKTRIFRLLRDQEPPTVEDMRMIAKAYDKDPSYFHEYRVEFVLAAMARRLDDDPDQAAVVFRRLVRAT